MEDLNKHQLILIVLLITFVTSIATGIITFTLLSEAPVEVTQNINRVVERTIEKVVPTEGQPEKVVTTVVVSEEDRIIESISKNKDSIVRLTAIGSDGLEIISGLGLIVSNDGVIVTDVRNQNIASSFNILLSDGKSLPSGKVFVDSLNGLLFIKVNIPKNDTNKYVFSPVNFGDSNTLKIGQSLIAVSGKESNAASIGRIFQLKYAEDKKSVTSIYSDIKISKAHYGSPLLNLSGEVVGLEAPFSELETEYSYIPSNVIKLSIPKALEELAK